jgi:pectate lyase
MTAHRRSILKAGIVGLSTAIAGCSGDSGGNGDDTTTEETTTTGESTNETTTTEESTTEMTTTLPDEPPRSASQFDTNDGFAEMAPWHEDDTPVFKVTEPTSRSFLKALAGDTGPRVVVFETSGTIDLDGDWIVVENDKLWLAGQTAPSPGITIVKGLFQIAADNCVLQHTRFRAGDEGAGGSPSDLDATGTADDTANNVLDHCSASWSTDEVLSVGYDTNNTTVSNCLIAEPLNDSLHPKGTHGYSSLVGNNAANVTLAGNVYAHTTDRNPRLKEGTRSVQANNLIHYYEDGCWVDPDTQASIIGNHYRLPQSGKANIFGDGDVYNEDNLNEGNVPMVGSGVTELDERPLWPENLEALPSGETFDHNMANVGARPADRTPQDEAVLRMIRNGDGRVIDSQSEVGEYPELDVNTHELDVPDSNLRTWLRQHALEVEQ